MTNKLALIRNLVMVLLVSVVMVAPVFAQPHNDLPQTFDEAVDYYWRWQPDTGLLIRVFTSFIDEDPEFVEAYAYRASVYRVAGDFESARADIETALTLDPLNGLALSVQARLLYDRGQSFQAIEIGDKAVEADDSNADVLYNRGRVALDNDETIEWITRAIEITPRAQFYYNRGVFYEDVGDFNSALQDYEDAIAIDPDMRPAYINASIIYIAYEMYEETIEVTSAAIDRGFGTFIIYHNRGIAYSYTGEYQKAVDDYLVGIRLNPTNPSLYNSLGIDYYNLQDYEAAVEAYTEAIELDPTYASAYYGRGLAYGRLGDDEAAEADFEMAESLGYQR